MSGENKSKEDGIRERRKKGKKGDVVD